MEIHFLRSSEEINDIYDKFAIGKEHWLSDDAWAEGLSPLKLFEPEWLSELETDDFKNLDDEDKEEVLKEIKEFKEQLASGNWIKDDDDDWISYSYNAHKMKPVVVYIDSNDYIKVDFSFRNFIQKNILE